MWSMRKDPAWSQNPAVAIRSHLWSTVCIWSGDFLHVGKQCELKEGWLFPPSKLLSKLCTDVPWIPMQLWQCSLTRQCQEIFESVSTILFSFQEQLHTLYIWVTNIHTYIEYLQRTANLIIWPKWHKSPWNDCNSLDKCYLVNFLIYISW